MSGPLAREASGVVSGRAWVTWVIEWGDAHL
jgi:hypothetical protein